VLEGELLIPEGKGPFPGLVFLSGAGQQDRYGFAGPPAVDVGSHFITDALANAGFVVLRYDEPGFGESPEAPPSFARQVSDARRAFATVLVQDAVDPDRIAVVGHGEGGWRALMLAGDRKEIRAVALLGTPGRPYRQVLLHQAEATLADLAPPVAEEARQTTVKMLDAIEAGGRMPPELAEQADWLGEILKVDVAELFEGVRARVLVVQGDKDFEVDPKRDVKGLQQGAKKGRVRLEVKRFETLDHLFMVEPERSVPARYLESGRVVDGAFLGALTTWLQDAVGGK
jgi:pimeloyl-ACP methyl ester carboxylesterase